MPLRLTIQGSPKIGVSPIAGLFRNPADLHFGIGLAMPDGFLVLLLTLELEDQNLIAATVARDGSFYRRHIHQFPSVVERRFDWQLDLRAHIAVQFLHAERIAGSDAVLLSACFNNCVHMHSLVGSRNAQTRAPEPRSNLRVYYT